MRPRHVIAAAVVLHAAPAAAQRDIHHDSLRAGLAPGASAEWSFADVRAELGLVFLIPPALVADELPSDFRAQTLRTLAAEDPLGHDALVAHPAMADYLVSVVTISRIGSARFGTQHARPMTFAYWSVLSRSGDSARSLDPRARSGREIEIGQWSSDTTFTRLLRSVWPVVRSGTPTARQAPDGTWYMGLMTPDATLEISCRPSGPVSPYGTPDAVSYGTHWAPGRRQARAFIVVAAINVGMQACDAAAWHATGSGALARAVREGLVLLAANFTGWRAHLAAYR